MRKPILPSVAILGSLLTFSLIILHCRKANNIVGLTPSDLIPRARAYVSNFMRDQSPVYQDGNPRNDRTQRSKDFLWTSAYITAFRGRPAVLVPIHFTKDIFVKTTWGGNNCFRLDNQEKLLVYQDSARAWHAELVTWLPDTAFLHSDQRQFTGMALVDDLWGNPLQKYRYEPDGTVERYAPEKDAAAMMAPRQMSAAVKAQGFIQICTYVYGYNYAVGNEEGGESWVEFSGCSTMYFPDNAGGAGGGGAYSGLGNGGGAAPIAIKGPLAASPIIFSPVRIILDIRDYLKCFEIVPGATFQVTVCVDQPSPGTRTPWVVKLNDGSSGSGAASAGHSYLILTEKMPGGWSITRNLGFYPSKDVTPFSSPVPGVLNDDENHPFDIAAQYSISGTLFFAMLQFIMNSAGDSYQANTNNCTNFVLSVLEIGHIYLPHTIGSWIGGLGVDPGDLGEDIRGFDFTGMTRITTSFFHSNLGICD